MNSQKLREEAKKILSQEDVQCIIGYAKDSIGFRVSPLFARADEDVENLFFSPLCSISLVNYLTLEKGVLLDGGDKAAGGKTAVFVRGCDSRALIQIISEKGISREEIVVLGIPCGGVIDLKKIETRFPKVRDSAEVEEKNGNYVIRCENESHEIPKEKLLAEHCKHCSLPNPLLYDVLLGKQVEEKEAEYKDIEAIEKMSIDKKGEFWKDQFSRCIRCYACRNACPLCYCDDCILERLSPKWVNRSVSLPENIVFHLARSFHLAGRCAGCGECERVCPKNLHLMPLNRKLEKDIKGLLDYTAGIDADQKPFFSTFDPKDPDDFIL